MQHQPIEQVATEATHQGLSFLGAGRTMLRFHGAGENSRHCDNSDDRAERLHAKDYTNYQLYVIHPSKEGIDKNIHSDTVSRIMEYEMIPDTLPHPTRSSITASQTFFGAGSAPVSADQQLTAATEILGAMQATSMEKDEGASTDQKADKVLTS